MPPCYKISTTSDEETCTFDYYPHGDGKFYRGYVTNYRQYESKLEKLFNKRIHYLWYYDKNGDYAYIQDDEDLQRAFDYRRSGYDLQVSAEVYDSEEETSGDSASESTSAALTSVQRTVSFSDETTTTTGRACSEQSNETIDDSARGYDNSVVQIVKQFVKHKRVSCHHCTRTKWSGVRYVYFRNYEYSMCGNCYGKLSCSRKRMWVADALPWSEDVPAYPLCHGDQGSEVRHLQYLLTRLGYMPLSATSMATGYFQDYTESALSSFRERYGIRGDEDEYGRRTARKLAEVVRKRRRQGHQLI